MRLQAFGTMTLAMALLLAAACSGEGHVRETSTVSPIGSFPTSTPPSPNQTAGSGTGIASVDAIARAVRARNYSALVPLIQFDPVPCTVAVGGAGGPPVCRADEAPGTRVNVALFASCEGFYVRADELVLEQFGPASAGDEPLLGAAFLVPTDSQLRRVWPRADYAVIGFRSAPTHEVLPVAFLADDRGIVGINNVCGGTVEDFLQNSGLTQRVVEG